MISTSANELETSCDPQTVAVIGAGIAGITTAYSLARRGYAVEVIDSEPFAAMKTSYANGGQFSVSNADTWCTWHNVGKGLLWMLRKDAPLLVRPFPTLSKMRWMAGFLYNTANGTQASNTEKTIAMALHARSLYHEIADSEGIKFDHRQNGILHFYKDAGSLAAAAKQCEFYQANGVNRYPISWTELIELEPALADSPGIIGGTYTPDDGMGDIHMFCNNLAEVLQTKYDVKFAFDTRVLSIANKHNGVALTMDGKPETTYAHVVICAGANSSGLGRYVEDPICVYPVKGYSITIPIQQGVLAPQTSLLDDDAKIVTSTLGDRLRVAGTAELDGWNLDIRADRINPLKRWVHANMPQISTEHAAPWAGLRPMTPSMMPVVRQSHGNHKVWWNTGHGHLGWTLAPATAEIVAELIG